MNNNTFNLIETLEDRTMMSASPAHKIMPRVAFTGGALNVIEAPVGGGTQLQITGTAGNDQISVVRTAQGLVVRNGNLFSQTFSGNYTSILVHAGAGNDVVTIDASVNTGAILYGDSGNDTLNGGAGNDRFFAGMGNDVITGGAGNDTIVAIGGGISDQITGGAGEDSFWVDSTNVITDASAQETRNGDVHRVGSFFNYRYNSNGRTATQFVSRDLLGQSFAEPTAAGAVYQNFSTHPLFADNGPSADDVQQGYLGDCYFLATLSSVAKTNANVIRQSVVDLGDGTYAVQFNQGSRKVYVRVDGKLATWGGSSLAYANTGAQSSIWVAIMEKAFAIYRTGTASYASTEGGWMDEAYSDLGKRSTGNYNSTSGNALLGWIKNELAAGKSVTFGAGNVAAGASLIGYHAYSVDAVIQDANGNMLLRLRNPWGIDGAGNDGTNDGYVTITAQQAWASTLGAVSAAL